MLGACIFMLGACIFMPGACIFMLETCIFMLGACIFMLLLTNSTLKASKWQLPALHEAKQAGSHKGNGFVTILIF
jgi:hypothetical protein